MIDQKVSKLNGYFDGQIALCGQRSRQLLADERTDEAAFEKVKANVYDIFRTILSVAVNTCKADPGAVERFFLQKAEQIPSSWAAAYDKAKQQGDVVKLQTEQIKLGTIHEIRENFARIWGETE